MNEEGERVSAIATLDDKILYIGSDEEAINLADGGEVIDLEGRTVLPGLIDTHQHVQAYARNLKQVNLRDVKTLEEIQSRLRERVKNAPKGTVILGAGFDHEKLDPPVMPTRHDLDEVSKDHPIVITRYCVHMNVANSLALELGGIGKGFVPKWENSVDFDEAGEPTGLLFEQTAADLISRIDLGSQDEDSIKNGVEMALREDNSYGITSINPIQGKLCDLFEQTRVYQDLRDEGRLSMRIYMGYDEFPGLGLKSGIGDEFIKYGFYKIYTDGSLGGHSALFNEPYSDDPENCGVANHSQEELNALVKEAYDKDLQIGVHMIGDKAIEMSLTALEACYFENPKEDIRFRMIHVSLINDEIIERMKKLPVILDIQPSYVSSNIHWSDARVGDRAKYLFSWGRFVHEGFICSGSSDSPVEPINPMIGIFAAVTRAGYDGYMPEGWHPENKMTRYEAVSMYTRNGAYASFEEDIKGTLAVGKLADFAIFDNDVFEVPEFEIKDIKVVATYLGAENIYSV